MSHSMLMAMGQERLRRSEWVGRGALEPLQPPVLTGGNGAEAIGLTRDAAGSSLRTLIKVSRKEA